jgi:hypothetical protein
MPATPNLDPLSMGANEKLRQAFDEVPRFSTILCSAVGDGHPFQIIAFFRHYTLRPAQKVVSISIIISTRQSISGRAGIY